MGILFSQKFHVKTVRSTLALPSSPRKAFVFMQIIQHTQNLFRRSLIICATAISSIALAQAEAPVLQPGGAAPGASPAAGAPPAWINFALIGGMVLFMYFFVIRPNSKRQKDHKTFLETLAAGKEVVTSSGLIGKIISVADSIVTIDLGNTTVRVLKSAVTGELGKAPADGSSPALATTSK
jgi:preprotein translocase subunit YajC